MPLASTLLVLLKRGATCRSPSSSKDRPATSIRQGLTRSPTSVAALVRNSLENLVLLGQMRSIRGYYRGLVPEAGEFFDPPEANVVYQAAVETIGLRASPGQALFTGATLPRADFSGCDLYQTHFAGAKLRGANFTGAELTYADFRHADLGTADLRRATLMRTVLHGANTQDAQMTDRARAIESDPELEKSERWQTMVA